MAAVADKRGGLFVAVSLALLAIPTNVPRAADRWRWHECAPGGDPIVDVAVNPANPPVLLALHPTAGLFRSQDGGAHWVHAGEDLKNPWDAWWLNGVAFSHDGQRAAVGTRGSGLFLSDDAGRTWHPAGIGFDLSVEEITRVEFDPRDDQHLLVGSNSGLFESRDGGQSVQRSPLPLGRTRTGRVLAVAFHPADSLKIYVSMETEGLYASNDGGASWRSAGNGLISAPRCLSISPDPGGDALVAGKEGLFRWGAEALRWIPTGSGLPRGSEVTSLLRRHGKELCLLAGTKAGGLYVSGDGGESWNRVAGAPRQPGPLALAKSAQGDLFLAGAGGLFRSSDGGAIWEPVLGGLPGMVPRALLSDPARAGGLLVGGAGGLAGTTDFGDDWRRLGEGLRGPQASINDLSRRSDPTGAQIAAATDGGIALSDDGGLTWRPTALDDWTGSVAWGFDPPVLLASGLSGGTTIVWRSGDDGATWTIVFRDSTASGAWVAADSSSKALFIQSHGLHRSDDGGLHWRLLPPPPGAARVNALVGGRKDTSRLVAGTDSGLFESVNLGDSWVQREWPGRRLLGLASDPTGGGWLAVLTVDALEIRPGGTSAWTRVPLHQLTGAPVLLTVDGSGQVLYVGTTQALYVSRIPPELRPRAAWRSSTTLAN